MLAGAYALATQDDESTTGYDPTGTGLFDMGDQSSYDLGLIVFAIPVGLLLLVITRVWLELLAVLFRIAHNTAPTPATPPSPQHQWSPASPAPVPAAGVPPYLQQQD
jgi:hypothetical protein